MRVLVVWTLLNVFIVPFLLVLAYSIVVVWNIFRSTNYLHNMYAQQLEIILGTISLKLLSNFIVV